MLSMCMKLLSMTLMEAKILLIFNIYISTNRYVKKTFSIDLVFVDYTKK